MAVLVNVPWPYFMIRYGRTFSTNTIPEFALPKRDLERWDTRCRHRMANRGQRLTQGGIPAAAKSQNYAKKAALALRPNKKAHGGGGGGEGEGKVEGEGEGYDADDDDGEAQRIQRNLGFPTGNMSFGEVWTEVRRKRWRGPTGGA